MGDIKRLKSDIERLQEGVQKAQEELNKAQLVVAHELNKWHCGTVNTKKDFELAEGKVMPLAEQLSRLLSELAAVKKDLETAIKNLDQKT